MFSLLRETGVVAIVFRLRAALERLNPALPPVVIAAAVDELTRDRSAMSLEAANRELYLLLKEGIKVSVPESDSTPHPGPCSFSKVIHRRRGEPSEAHPAADGE